MEPLKIAVIGATGRVGRPLVDDLDGRGHEVVPISRSHGVDVVTGEGLAAALKGVDRVVDAASGASPDEQEATAFFTNAARNLQAAAERNGVEHIVAVSIIGCDRFTEGYNAAKVVQERELLAGPVPVTILRAAQFHEFVGQLVDWCTQGDVSYLPRMRTQLVAATAVAEAAADLTTGAGAPDGAIHEVAGPREERLADVAGLLAARRGHPARVEEVTDSPFPGSELFATGALLPGPHARLAGPTFAEWLDSPAGVAALAAA